MKRYSLEIKMFALQKRRQNIGWREVRQAIERKFEIQPPTIRVMQGWEKQFGTKEGFTQAVSQNVKEKAEAAKSEVITQILGNLLPHLMLAKDAGEDVESAGWKWFFSMLEKVLGSEKFERFLREYLSEREGKPLP
jgi:hypothetical protein